MLGWAFADALADLGGFGFEPIGDLIAIESPASHSEAEAGDEEFGGRETSARLGERVFVGCVHLLAINK